MEVHCEFCHMCFSHVPTMSSKMKASRKLSNSAKLIELNRLQKNSTFGDGFDLLPTELLFKLFAWAHSFGNSVLKHLLGHVGEVKQCQVTVRLVDIDKMIVEQFTSPE